MEDTQIIDLYFSRSENAIKATESKYGQYCKTIANNILCNINDSEECVNDTYLQTWNSIPPTRPNNFKAFLARITRNLSLNKLKSKNTNKRKISEYSLAYDELENMLSTAQTTDAYVDEIFLKNLLDEFLETLSKESRMIFIGRYWYFDSISEISKKLKISESKTKMSLLRTRNSLKDYLQKEGVVL